jgi:hypothetical protein
MITHYHAMSRLANLLNSSLFQKNYKLKRSAFTRNRKLTFPIVAGMILRMIKQSLQITCNWFGDLIGSEPASKQAFSLARQQISPECFQALHADGLETNYTLNPQKGLWFGFRIIAADGSTLRLPESEDLAEEFGRWPTREGINISPPIARISEFTDMTTKLVLSGRIAPCNTSEDELAKEQLTEVVQKMISLNQKNLLFVYDRGYPSEEFINQHIELGVDFIFRVPKNFNKAISEIYQGKEQENFLITETWPLLRVSQFTLPGGEDELLLTTLTDERLYSQEALSEVYHGRWTAMEEGYKKQKITMQLENFSGKTVVAIRQEYWATLTVGNLMEMGCIEIEGHWIPGSLPKRHVNRSVIFGSMRDATIEAIFEMISMEEYSSNFERMAKRSMLKVRPGRNYSRAGVGKPKNHHVYRRAC